MTKNEKLTKLSALIMRQTYDRMKRDYPGTMEDCLRQNSMVKTIPGKKFIKVDVGSSGKYMIDMTTEIIYGIKAYGKVHYGHIYGSLDTIDAWYWGDYVAIKIWPGTLIYEERA